MSNILNFILGKGVGRVAKRVMRSKTSSPKRIMSHVPSSNPINVRGKGSYSPTKSEKRWIVAGGIAGALSVPAYYKVTKRSPPFAKKKVKRRGRSR